MTYPSCPIKRQRRTKSAITRLESTILEIAESEYPVTCRQLFYRMVSAGAIDKSEPDYNNVIIRLCSKLRESGAMPWSWITDGTRLMRKPDSYSSLNEALRITKECYRRALWQEQNAYVEVWCEKDALTGVIYPITAEWDVPLMVTRGFSSSTFLHGAAETIAAKKKPTFIYYLGDYDPSGLHIWADIQKRLLHYSHKATAQRLGPNITFERIAITPAQVRKYNLPTRPTKTKGTHAKGFVGLGESQESIEVDALPPRMLRALVQEAITRHIDWRQLEITRIAEGSEREVLSMYVEAS